MYQRQKIEKTTRHPKKILENFKGVSSIPGIKSAKKKVLITKVKNEQGEVITSRKGIANIFGEFCKNYTTTMSKTNLNEKSEKIERKAAPS